MIFSRKPGVAGGTSPFLTNGKNYEYFCPYDRHAKSEWKDTSGSYTGSVFKTDSK